MVLNDIHTYTISSDDLIYKKHFFDCQFTPNSESNNCVIHPIAVNEDAEEIEFYLDGSQVDNDGFWSRFHESGVIDELSRKKKISLFCHFDCAKLADHFHGFEQHSVHLTYFRKEKFSPIHNVGQPYSIGINEGYDTGMVEKMSWKLERDLFIPLTRFYGSELLEYLKQDFFELVKESRNIYAVKGDDVVGHIMSLPYFDEKLLIHYNLIGSVWLDRTVLNKEERRFISEQFFSRLSNEQPPFGAAVHIDNAASRKYFQKNGFVPYWIRISKK